MTQADIDKNFSFTDSKGNVFRCKNGKITLKITSKPNLLHIGRIEILNGYTVYVKDEKESDMYRKTPGWTIPMSIYEKVDGVWYKTEEANYKILKSKVDQYVEQVRFKDPSEFEPKVLIPIRFWSQSSLK